ncbi:MAG: NAD(P)H-binding protein [Bacteroidales bacterium]|jgi:uncharacterized protein YbjT (DUF2867 family)|nr:NAD(P)H-binding protein [Bacteroidales bacterium]HOI32438.1 NAD(P)H-binding protein [Bacteroidales bacterium]
MNETYTIIGSTGLIGNELLKLMSNDESLHTIRLVNRRSVALKNDKTQQKIIDFQDEAAFREAIAGSDAVFVCVGTTHKKVKGDQIAYRKVDYDIPVNAARYCAETKVEKLLIVSSIGADVKSRNFYTRLKGEMEAAVTGFNLPLTIFFRPSMLLGQRKEFRLGESIGKMLMKPIGFLLPENYRPVQASFVAKTMLLAAKSSMSGHKVFHLREMKQMINV